MNRVLFIPHHFNRNEPSERYECLPVEGVDFRIRTSLYSGPCELHLGDYIEVTGQTLNIIFRNHEEGFVLCQN